MANQGRADINPIHVIERRLKQILTLNIREYLRKWIPLSILIGLVGGVGAIIFQILLEMIWHLSYETYAIPWYLVLFIPAVGGLIVGYVIPRTAPEAVGHGTNDVIEALHHSGGRIRGIVVPVKIVVSAITIGTGGSAGREGPISQIGAGLGSVLGRKLKLSRSDLKVFVIAGMAAGFSAVFKAPLGSAIFAMEIPYKNDLESNAVIPSIIASIVSYLVFIPVYGPGPAFDIPPIDVQLTAELFAITILVGVLAGAVGIIYVKTLTGIEGFFENAKMPLYLKTGAGGLMVGIIGLSLPSVLGLSHGLIEDLLQGVNFTITILIALLIAKIVATSLTVGSGGSGGVFFPSLVIGGTLGAIVGTLLSPQLTPIFVAVGMGSMMAGVTKTPVSSSVLMAEMIGGFIAFIPLAIASVISYIITGKNTIYSSQIAQKSFELDVSNLSKLRIADVMKGEVVTIPEEASIEEAAMVVRRSPHYLYPVVSGEDKIIGVAPRERILDIDTRIPSASILQVLQSHFEPIPADKDSLEAFDIMNEKQISRMIVVDPIEGRRVVGILTRLDLLMALEKLDERHHEF
jgi:CIC family chloride channel protein